MTSDDTMAVTDARPLGESSSCCAPETQWFTPARAFTTIFSILSLILIVYFLVHSFKPVLEKPWSNGVVIAPDGSFNPELRLVVLEKFFASEEIDRLSDRLKKKCTGLSQKYSKERRAQLHAIQQQLRDGLGDEHVNTLAGILSKTPAVAQDADYVEADLERVIAQVRDQQHNPQLSAAREQWLKSALRDLEALHAREQSVRSELAQEIALLEPALYFLWAYHDKAGWIFEVVVWSLIGIICNTIIALIMVCRSGTYRACEFIMVFPKILLAPILAVIAVTWWSSGFSESRITYLNLPYFIIASFALGFLTEGVYARMRRIADAVIGNVTSVSETKLASGDTGRASYMYRYRAVDPRAEVRPETIDELAARLKDYIKGTLERELVKEAARKP